MAAHWLPAGFQLAAASGAPASESSVARGACYVNTHVSEQRTKSEDCRNGVALQGRG